MFDKGILPEKLSQTLSKNQVCSKNFGKKLENFLSCVPLIQATINNFREVNGYYPEKG